MKRKNSERQLGDKSHKYGVHLSINTKMKISNALKGRVFSEEHKKNLSESKIGEKCVWFGKKHLDETKIKIKIGQPFKKKIEQFTLDNTFIKTFDFINDAEKETGIYHQNIGKACSGKYKTAGGYIWRYA